MSRFSGLRLLWTLGLLTLGPRIAAVPVMFSSEAAYLAEASTRGITLALESFETLAVDSVPWGVPLARSTVAGLGVTLTTPQDDMAVYSSGILGLHATDGVQYVATRRRNQIVFTLDSPATSFAVTTTDALDGAPPQSLSLTTNGGDAFNDYAVGPQASATENFIGIFTDVPFTVATIVMNFTGDDGIGVDGVRFNSVTCAASDLVSWWPGEGNTDDVEDGNDGTLMNGAAFAAGQVGQGFYFDGADEHVLIGNPSNLQLQDFSIVAWIQLDVIPSPGVAILNYGSGGYGFSIPGSGASSGAGGLNPIGQGELLLTKIGVNGVSSQGMTISDTNFHHVAVTKSGGTVKFYLDGAEHTVAISYNPGFTFTTNVGIGIRPDILAGDFPGVIDELQVYSRALSAGEVQALLIAGSAGGCAGQLTQRVPAVLGPAEPIELFVDLTSTRNNIAAVGARLSYDSAKVTFVSLAKGAGIPAAWSFVYSQTATAGEVDFVLTDDATAVTLAGPVTDLEVVQATFSRIGLNCDDDFAFGFNSAAPVGPAAEAAFPENHYTIHLDAGAIITEAATTTGASGPPMEDRAFIRGNLNNRAAHVLDLGDIIDLVNHLFAALVLGFDCEAAIDVNDDGLKNIIDVVALVHGAIVLDFTIPPPNSVTPGLGIPGAVVPDGGSIPSMLGCNEGETCP